MCKLCDKIYNEEESKKWFKDGCTNNIIALKNNKKVFYSAISDWYYTPETKFEINYCPVCGRKLAED